LIIAEDVVEMPTLAPDKLRTTLIKTLEVVDVPTQEAEKSFAPAAISRFADEVVEAPTQEADSLLVTLVKTLEVVETPTEETEKLLTRVKTTS
jgi:hypothetical protein